MNIFGPQTASKSSRGVFTVALVWAVVVVAVYLYLFIIISRENSRVLSLDTETARLLDERKNIVSLKGRVAETASKRSKLTGYFVPADGVVPFLNNLQGLGKESGVAVQVGSVSVDNDTNAPDMIEHLTLSLDVSGGWSNVYRFVSLVELLPYKVFIESVDFERVSTESLNANKSKKTLSAGDWTAVVHIDVLKLK